MGTLDAVRLFYLEGEARMAQSQNSTVDLATPATCLMGLTSHGNVMVGNKAFEYYNERNPEDYIQIPWDEVDYIAAEVLRGTKKFPKTYTGALFVKTAFRWIPMRLRAAILFKQT